MNTSTKRHHARAVAAVWLAVLPRGQREVTSLAVIGASNGRVYAESRMAGAADCATLRFAGQFVECERR